MNRLLEKYAEDEITERRARSFERARARAPELPDEDFVDYRRVAALVF